MAYDVASSSTHNYDTVGNSLTHTSVTAELTKILCKMRFMYFDVNFKSDFGPRF